MAKPWPCASCGAINEPDWTKCEGCGAARGAVVLPMTRGPAVETSAGYPAQMVCPHACPICRGPLGWDGGCERCHGCTTGRREDWAFPGDRYELAEGYWRKVDEHRKACSPEENAGGFAAIRAILARVGEIPRSGRGLPAVDPAIRAVVERRP